MTARRSLWALSVALVAASAVYADKDDSQFIPGKLVYLQHKKTTVYTTLSSNYTPLWSTTTKTYKFVVKVGDIYYIGEAEKSTRLSER